MNTELVAVELLRLERFKYRSGCGSDLRLAIAREFAADLPLRISVPLQAYMISYINKYFNIGHVVGQGQVHEQDHAR